MTKTSHIVGHLNAMFAKKGLVLKVNSIDILEKFMKKTSHTVGHFIALFVNPSLVPKVNSTDILQKFMKKTRHLVILSDKKSLCKTRYLVSDI